MSFNEWESGTITLPTAAVPGLRQALNAAITDHRALVVAEVDAVWNTVKARPIDKRVAEIPDSVAFLVSYDDVHEHRRADAMSLAQDIVRSSGGRKPTTAAISRVIPVPNTRTHKWKESELGLKLDGRTLTWNVPERNHACDLAATTHLQQAALRYLNTVTWTRGTGGVIVGNDDENREDTSHGGGGNYVLRRFGPAGR